MMTTHEVSAAGNIHDHSIVFVPSLLPHLIQFIANKPKTECKVWFISGQYCLESPS